MAIVLNIDTATAMCSVSLSKNGRIIALKESIEEKAHAANITVFIAEVLQKGMVKIEQLDAIAVSKGPGSYTGLRIGVSVAKGLCYGRNIPLIAINTLLAMASGFINNTTRQYPDDTLFCPMIDARRSEVYTALYTNNLEEVIPTCALVINENSFNEQLEKQSVIFFGNGANKCKSLISHKNAVFIEDFIHSSSFMALLSEQLYVRSDFENIAYFEPFYLKDFVTTMPKNKIF